jgi:hypothetical protein
MLSRFTKISTMSSLSPMVCAPFPTSLPLSTPMLSSITSSRTTLSGPSSNPSPFPSPVPSPSGFFNPTPVPRFPTFNVRSMPTTFAAAPPGAASPAAAATQGTDSGSAGAGTGAPNFTFHGEEDRSHGYDEFRQTYGLNNADESMKVFKLGLFQGFIAAELEKRTKTKDLTVTAEGSTVTKLDPFRPTELPNAKSVGKHLGKIANKALELALKMGVEQGRKMFERATGLDEPELKKIRELLSHSDTKAVNQALEGNKALLKALLPNTQISGLEISSSAPAGNSNAGPTPSSQAVPRREIL